MQLEGEVSELLRRAQEVDDEEDRRYGKDKRGDELPEELAFREGRLEKIREAMAALEAEAQVQAGHGEAEGKAHSAVTDGKAQRNFTDPQSRIMTAPGGWDFLQGYNCQAVVDSAHQVIVAARATNQISDKLQAVTMMEEAIDNTGTVPREVSADAGYYSAKAPTSCRNGVWTCTLRWTRPATAPCGRPHPEDAFPRVCPPGTECGASCRPSGVVSVTPSGWRRWNQYSVRSSRVEASASSCYGDWTRSTANGR